MEITRLSKIGGGGFLVGKLVDICVLLEYSDKMNSTSLQFGFKRSSSAAMCTTVLKEVASHYANNGSHVYCLLLDASIAFDRVEYTRLFDSLIDRKLNVLYIRCLLYMYTTQKLRVQWQGCRSDSFTVMNGVKQGGVISPTLFSVYVQKLLDKLQDTKVGCHIGPHFVGAMAYADDLVILSPSKSGLNKSITVCEKFSEDSKVHFNGSKSQFLIFHGDRLKPVNTSVTFGGATIENQEYATHLGHKVYANLKLDDTAGVTANFYKQVNMFNSKFNMIPSYIQDKLFIQYCSSFYGFCLLQALQ
jgi:hypothetical protein